MPRYIDADDFYKRLSNPPYTIYNGEMFAEWFEECFKTQPTADVEPVRHGRWVKIDDYVVTCSECGRLEKRLDALSYPHCHCGAKMDGDNNGKDNSC